MPGRQTPDFVPLTLAAEMLLREKCYSHDLLSMFIEYCSVDVREVQTYTVGTPSIALSLASALSGVLLKMPSQVQLVSNLLQPHLRYSLSFQLFTMTNDKRIYNKLKTFIRFLDNLFITVSNNEFLGQISRALFNLVLLHTFQPRILSFASCPMAARTAVQYLTLILENTTSRKLVELVFHFLFGFSGFLPYHSMEEVMNGSRVMEVEDNPFETSKLDSDTKSIYEYYSADNSEELNSLVLAMSSVLEDSKSSFLEDYLDEDKKGSVLSQQGERFDTRFSVLPPKFSSTVDVKDFALERHNPTAISTVLVTMLKYTPNGYSNIVLQLFAQLVSFDVRQVYDVLVYSGLESFGCCYSEQSVEELIQLFPYYQKMLKETKPAPLNGMYHGVDVALGESGSGAQSNPAKAWSRSLKELSADGAQSVRKSCVVPTSLLSPKPSDLNYECISPSKHYSPEERLRLPSETNASPSLTIKPQENPFMRMLLSKLERMLYNSFEENLFISSILLKLFSLPVKPADESSVALQGLLLDSNSTSVISILKNTVAEIIKAYEKLPKLEEVIGRRREVHRRAALNIVSGVRHNARIDRLADVAFPLV